MSGSSNQELWSRKFQQKLEQLLSAVASERRQGVQEAADTILDLAVVHKAQIGQGGPQARIEALSRCVRETLAVLRAAHLPGYWPPGIVSVMDHVAAVSVGDVYWTEVRWLTRNVDEIPRLPSEHEHPMQDLQVLASWCQQAQRTLAPVPAVVPQEVDVSKGTWVSEREGVLIHEGREFTIAGGRALQVFVLMARKGRGLLRQEDLKHLKDDHGADVDVSKIKRDHIKIRDWPSNLFRSVSGEGTGFAVPVTVIPKNSNVVLVGINSDETPGSV